MHSPSSRCDGSDVHPDGKNVLRVRKSLNRQSELNVRVPGLVDTRGLHHPHDVVHVDEAGL